MHNEGSGFTLVELLVVIAIIGIFFLSITQIFFGVIRSQSQSEITKDVKQQGDYAFSVMESMIRNAKDVTYPSCGGSDTALTITNPDNGATTFDCGGSQIASNSSSLTSTNVAVSNCTFVVNPNPCPAGAPKYVYINFTIKQANAAAGVGESATQTYQGTVSLRTY
ncbi:type II secretion system protein [Candidatus Gottesmanbacteria bacterium]|nr:type II secretion system protein [Candidatus Gottesmanbacteria bacterium]